MGQEKNNSEQWPEKEPQPYGLGVRHLQVACMCACVTALLMARGCMGVAVLAMTDPHRLNDTSITIYEWDKKTQGVILSSFFWGYVAMQVPAGELARRFGGKLILLVALLANGSVALLIPIFAKYGGWMLVCGARVVMGLSQAATFPASHTLIGRWLPARERTTYSGIVYGGMQLGTIIAMPVSGMLAETALGWQLIFYGTAALMFATAAVWATLTASSPADHRLISQQEREYIERDINAGKSVNATQRALRTPWRHILRSVPVWAMVAAHLGSNFAYILFFADMPTYLEKGLGISLKNSALLSALPYIGMWVGGTASTLVCGKLFNRGILSAVACRKIFNSIGLFGCTIGLVILSFLGPEHKTLAITVLIFCLTVTGATLAGFMMNHLDLSPNFAGVLMSLTNFSANFASILMPIYSGVILRKDPTDLSRWRVVMLTTAALTSGCNLLYVLLGSSDRQPWDDPNFADAAVADPEEMKPVINQEKEKEANKT